MNAPIDAAGASPTTAGRGSLAVLARLLPFVAPYRARVVAAGLALLVAAGAALAIPAAFREMIDAGFASNLAAAAQGAASVNRHFAALFGVAVVLAAGTAVRFFLVSWLGERVTADLRNAVYRSVLRQDPSFYETLKSGEVLSRLTADTTLIETLVGTSISLGLRNAVLFAGGIAMLIVTSPSLAALIIGLLMAVVAPIIFFGRRVRKLSRASQDRVADTSALAGETLNAIQIVQAYAREPFESQRFAQATGEAFQASVRRIRARSLLTALVITLVFGVIVFVLWLGAHAVIDGRMTAGQLTQFVLYAAMVAGATGALAEVFGDVQRAAGATERLLELLTARPRIASMAPESAPGAVSQAAASSSASHAPSDLPTQVSPGSTLDFNAVNFSYPSRPAEQALASVSFHARAGETVALVGPSGAGKTTVFQLLLRFYDPQSGAISLDGVDIRTLDPATLRSGIGFVSQDSVVFSADVMENIRYGRLDASDDEVIEAARAAHADEFVQRLPQGYRTYVGERGVRLSGGQRQRIAIARALLKNPPLLLLDEATSALDAESEAAVQQALDEAMRGRTTLVIAHRLATVIGASRILVLDRGRIVESGTHDELTSRAGLYARLAEMQFASTR